jgi:hypothetical protein
LEAALGSAYVPAAVGGMRQCLIDRAERGERQWRAGGSQRRERRHAGRRQCVWRRKLGCSGGDRRVAACWPCGSGLGSRWRRAARCRATGGTGGANVGSAGATAAAGGGGQSGASAAAGAGGAGKSGGANRVLSQCRFHFGTTDGIAKTNPAMIEQLDFFTPGWMGQKDTFDMQHVF